MIQKKKCYSVVMFASKRIVLYNTSVYVVNVKQYILGKESTRCHANIIFQSGGKCDFFKTNCG